MKPPSSPFDSAQGKPFDPAQGRRAIRAYGRLLWLLRGRDPQEQRAIKEDAELLLDAARARGRGAFAATWLALMWDLVIVGTGHDLARALRSLVRAPGFTLILFGIAPQDPLTLGTTAAVLLTAVLAASWLPARRAARINPVSAMRI
jgi:hypothetical protein